MDRIDRINQQIKQELGNILLRDLSDPRLILVTITAVKTTRDLRHARVFFSVLGDTAQIESVENGLRSASGRIRRLISKRLTFRNVPDFSFFYDKSIEEGSRIDQTLSDIHDEEDYPNN
ncbi:hypothetical protein MNBD_UNCLBAC01-5 [hydrothermal vent metagenome]|uniref:Ribosome-binding factor A n=1 Tax=hydrothermal vent metagenome TaxID=652676 RepID=A0A3B1D6J1_9ZZZZ